VTGRVGALFLAGGRGGSILGSAVLMGGCLILTGGAGSEASGSGSCIGPLNLLKNLAITEKIFFKGLKKFILKISYLFYKRNTIIATTKIRRNPPPYF